MIQCYNQSVYITLQKADNLRFPRMLHYTAYFHTLPINLHYKKKAIAKHLHTTLDEPYHLPYPYYGPYDAPLQTKLHRPYNGPFQITGSTATPLRTTVN